jgi:uncharacterized alpha-E superfamily protein
MLLSRVAENLFWAARYLERTEDTARVVREHTNLIIDVPISLMSSWEPLLAIAGERDDFDSRYERADEAAIIDYLISDRDNPSSIVSCVIQARENLRTCREVVPKELWGVVNDLRLFVDAHHREGVDRRSRPRFLDHVIAENQRAIGILAGSMSHDSAFVMLRLGRHIERADMTTRVLDVRVGALMAAHTDRAAQPSPASAAVGGRYDDLQWTSLLRSLAALQMFHRARPEPVNGPATVQFILHEPTFPRSLNYCLAAAAHSIATLPAAALILPAVTAANDRLEGVRDATLDAESLHQLADDLQADIARIDERLTVTTFRPVSPPH